MILTFLSICVGAPSRLIKVPEVEFRDMLHVRVEFFVDKAPILLEDGPKRAGGQP